jgi:hypothetical protein
VLFSSHLTATSAGESWESAGIWPLVARCSERCHKLTSGSQRFESHDGAINQFNKKCSVTRTPRKRHHKLGRRRGRPAKKAFLCAFENRATLKLSICVTTDRDAPIRPQVPIIQRTPRPNSRSNSYSAWRNPNMGRRRLVDRVCRRRDLPPLLFGVHVLMSCSSDGAFLVRTAGGNTDTRRI